MANEKKCCMPFESEFFMPSWICGQCNPKTMNGNQRDECKACGHIRCDNPKVKRVAFKEEDGVRIIAVNTDKSKTN